MNEFQTELNIIREMYKENQNLIIFDAGGYDFYHAIKFKNIFPLATVYSFEADSININTYASFASNNNVNIVPFGLSDIDGSMSFFSSTVAQNEDGSFREHRASGSILKPITIKGTNRGINHPNLYFDEKPSQIKTIRLDTFCRNNKINKIDFFHLDVQGAEHIVLKGLGNELRPKYIFAETCEYTTYDVNDMNKEKFNKFMENLGYIIVQEFTYDTLYKHIK